LIPATLEANVALLLAVSAVFNWEMFCPEAIPDNELTPVAPAPLSPPNKEVNNPVKVGLVDDT
jgi:hypothetical protein